MSKRRRHLSLSPQVATVGVADVVGVALFGGDAGVGVGVGGVCASVLMLFSNLPPFSL